MNKHTIALAELTSGTWLIEQQAGNLAFATLMEHGAPVDSVSRPNERTFGFISTDYLATQLGLGSIPEGSGIVVIRLQGMLYEYESVWIEAEIDWADRRAEALAVVLAMNCPGGPEHAAYRVHDALLRCKKPTIAYCDHGLMGSGGLLMAMGADRIVASRFTDEIGSIGAFTTFRDAAGMWKASGYTIKEVYADQSTEKNAEYRAAQAGNFKPMAAQMTRKADDFINLVKARRPKAKATAAGDPFKGGLFSARQALEMGLIDAIEPMDVTLKTVLTLLSTDNSLSLNPDDTMFGYVKLPALLAVAGVQPDQLTDAQVSAINAELTAQGYTGLAVLSQKQFSDAADAATKLTTLQTEVTSLKAQLAAQPVAAQPDATQLATLQTQLASLTTERDNLKATVATLSALPGAAPTVVVTPVDPATPVTGQAQLTAEQIIANLPSSRALDNHPFFGE